MAEGSSGLEVVTSVEGVREAVARARAAAGGGRVGLVPTMGALHAGHAHLIERCRELADHVVVSIFVNPTQFGPTEDLARYPRTLERDLEVAAGAGASIVFTPTEEVIYPRGKAATFVEVPGLSHVLEGAVRPTHFRGVATVVLALFEIVRPDLAVFGRKDFQQQVLIRRMVDDLHVPVQVVAEATVREADGLALSSRNRYLNEEERAAATVLHRALQSARAAVLAGERDAGRVRQILDEAISLERLARLDYAEVADADSLEPLVTIDPARPAVALVAARFGSTRLIDNLLLAE
ncbi:Pantoate-beta-alanine ligase [Aquisphaera giovannonii]|uniref:Pantothenate synthetase n=1 Tax=Aquisphaera giovannonii TaxID=406548 RepID=A0A5B9WBP1_9BACT|nr:pantoate--beta-alanine ligase [Aquisphaera giovannonii]QEH37992.1 Pantoate-beta-alanine ligase [Aquisphaera giovannonii]